MFLYVLPFIVLVLIFAYYPLYGWVYAFFELQTAETIFHP